MVICPREEKFHKSAQQMLQYLQPKQSFCPEAMHFTMGEIDLSVWAVVRK